MSTRLCVGAASTHATYIQLSVEYRTQLSIKATKFNRQKFCVRGDRSNKRTMLQIAWQRYVWITKD